MDKNQPVYPMIGTIEYPDGSTMRYECPGETYFQRCAREFTASALQKTIGTVDIHNHDDIDIKKACSIGVKAAMELQRQLEEIENVSKK
jgi:hypothetical protein